MNREILPKVFFWLFVGLLVTFASGFAISMSDTMVTKLYSSNVIWIVLMIVEVGVALGLNLAIRKLSGPVATCLYLFYAFLTGVTFTSLFIYYEMSSIIFVFLITSILFGIFALIGKFTKIDLSKIGIYLAIGVLAIIVLSIINIFVKSEGFDLGIAIIGVVIFLGYTAYDIQMIMRREFGLEERNMAIIGAFSLYLDFINLFMDLLRIMGKEKR